MLNELIEAHKAALSQFEAACEKLEATEKAYEQEPEATIHLLNMSPCVSEGREYLCEHVDDTLGRLRRQMPLIEKLSPDFAGKFSTFIDEAQATLYRKIDDALAEEERRQADFGLSAAQADWEAASLAENDAMEALASYHCKDHAEERERLAYVLTCDSIKSAIEDIAPAIIASVGGAQ